MEGSKEYSTNSVDKAIPPEISITLQLYKDAEKTLSSRIEQLEMTIQNKRLAYEKESNSLNNSMQQLITKFNAVVGGITALNETIAKLQSK